MLDHWVPEGVLPVRADRYLQRLLPGTPGHVLRDVFWKRDVKCNGRRIDGTHIVQPGDELRVYLPEAAQGKPLEVVYEDGNILLVHKPRGISVTEDAGGGRTLADMAAAYAEEHGEQARPCHRLDHHTGGLVLFAKTDAAYEQIVDAFAKRTLEKRYVCLVRGCPVPREAELHGWLLKDAEGARVQVFAREVRGALPIVTRYSVCEVGEVSRLSVELVTGRTHQIRAHLASIGHPILGDDQYGDRDFNRAHGVRFQMLWATDLTLHFDGSLAYLDGHTFHVDAPF